MCSISQDYAPSVSIAISIAISMILTSKASQAIATAASPACASVSAPASCAASGTARRRMPLLWLLTACDGATSIMIAHHRALLYVLCVSLVIRR